MRELPAPLAPLGGYRQFIVYQAQPSALRPGKTDKFPCDFRTGRVISAHDAAYWTDASTAIAAAATFGQAYGIGFVFTESDPFWVVDIDDCLMPDGSGWSPIALNLCQALGGAAIEVSQSGRGLHVIGSGRPPEHGCKNTALHLEFYHAGRFIALTGANATGNAAADLSAALPGVVAAYFPPSESQLQDWSDGPVPEWRGPVDDAELLRRALRSQSSAAAFGGRASFADLWTCNLDALARAYPDPVRPYDASSADAALAQHLAFWTGKDCERIQRLMQQSALVRDKWEREDYLPRTITGAVSRQFEVLTDKAPEPLAAPAAGPLPTAATEEAPRPAMVQGATFLSVDQQLDLFSGCVYVRDLHKVLTPGGVLMKPDQFRVAYGGYTMTMDHANERTSRDAWEAFTQSQAYRCPRADAQAFRPDLPAASLIQRDGQTFVNTYWPVDVPRKVGDATPFLDHLRRVLPNERDAAILLYYMAACVQHAGVKFQWAPLLQGVEGNGKTLFTRCVAEAIGRRYVHWPKASKLAAQFNSWMVGKLFYGVEDIYIPDSRAEVFEELKPMITGGDGLEIEGKGVDQISADICGNFMLNSNHKDAVRKTQNDRRICTLFCAQQQAGDLARDGMGGDYFPKLYDWLKADGYAIVSELLHTLPIPDEYNPATACQRAPVTSSTAEAISASTGGIEQEIAEAIAQGLPGFCGGWISSIQLDRLLERLGATRRITHSKRREMLQQMGYVCHPALIDGRVNNTVMPDGGKPRLFILQSSPACALPTAAEAARAYEQANNGRLPLPFSTGVTA